MQQNPAPQIRHPMWRKAPPQICYIVSMAAVPNLLTALEGLSVVAFLAVAISAVAVPDEVLAPLDPVALSSGPAEERWMGIFMSDQHVGYAVSREAPTAEGGRVFQQQSTFSIQAMGNVQRVVAAGTAVTGPDGALKTFDFMLTSPLPVYARGEVQAHNLHVTVDQGGSAPEVIDIPLTEPPVLSMTLPSQVRGKVLRPGLTFTVPYFDPLTRANATATVLVESPEMLPTGETAWWLKSSFNGVETRQLVDPNGEVLREEGSLGLRAERMTREDAMALSNGTPPDLIALTNIPVAPVAGAENSHIVTITPGGVDASRFVNDPPLQTVDGKTITISVPLLAELPHLPVAAQGAIEEADTEPAMSIPSTDPEMIARAVAVLDGSTDRTDAARKINDWVHHYVQKVPTIGIPNGLEVLHTAQGDCNEHTALYVSLARAVGIPARITAGLVYAPSIGDAFYYHAWPEVRIGPVGADGAAGWVPVDPTFGQFPADATHLKIVNGDLDKQIEIMGLIGKVSLVVNEAR